MDIAYNELPFEAYLVVRPGTNFEKHLDLGPWKYGEKDRKPDETGATIEENDEFDLYFRCNDPNAKLFFSALECCPMTPRIQALDGMVYCRPGVEAVVLYRSDSTDYDPLRVDSLPITVKCGMETYSTLLNVIPKQMSAGEWKMMRDDLEEEIQGLAQDIVRRNIGLGQQNDGVLPPEDLYAFLVIQKQSHKAMSALLDIKDKPKYALLKVYHMEDESEHKEIDTNTVKHYLRRGAPDHKMKFPRREVVYDIQENRLLKRIIRSFEEKLQRFTAIIDNSIKYHRQCYQSSSVDRRYEEKCISGLEEYRSAAKKLKAISKIISTAEWFQEVGTLNSPYIPHSFALDARYGTLYRIYKQINCQEFPIQLDTRYSYAWKRSSYLYEMWCYICVCRYLLKTYRLLDPLFEDIYTGDQLFPFLESGKKVRMENDSVMLEVTYDVLLPKKSSATQMYSCPLFITGSHSRPDICIDLYSKRSGWYVGSYIIECKYRKLSSFWGSGTWNSREQITDYHIKSMSPFLYAGKLEGLTIPRPVHKVLVFSPDDILARNREDMDRRVSIKVVRPSTNHEYVHTACDFIVQEIDKVVQSADNFFNQFQGNIL